MTFVIENVTSKWMNEFFTVYVSNDFGASGFKVAPEERNPKVHMFGKRIVQHEHSCCKWRSSVCFDNNWDRCLLYKK